MQRDISKILLSESEYTTRLSFMYISFAILKLTYPLYLLTVEKDIVCANDLVFFVIGRQNNNLYFYLYINSSLIQQSFVHGSFDEIFIEYI